MAQDIVQTDSIRVLLIDDNPADVAALEAELRDISAGEFAVDRAATLADGLRKLGAGNFNVVLLDLGLPDSKGQETIRELTAKAPWMPVVILADSDDEVLVLQAINQGVQEYFVKGTADEHRLAWAIRYAIHRKHVEQSLRESERQLRGTFENDAIAIAHVDSDGRFLRVNQRLCDLLGYTKAQILSRSFQDVTFPADLPSDLVLFKQLAQGEQASHSTEKRLVRADGSVLWVRVTRSLQRQDGDLAYCISFIEDIADRKMVEARLKQMATELSRSNKDLDQFAAVASHDLQEPLRMVTGFLKLVNERYAPQLDDNAREYIGLAVDGARRMSHLIRDLLAYSRVGQGGNGFVDTDMEAVLANALGNLQASIKETGAVITHDPLPKIKAEQSLMSQLLSNLVGNAIKYRAKDAHPQIHVGAQRDDRIWVFSIRDNGIGIKAEDCDRVFMIFQRLHTRQEYPGTGVGLAICKRILEHHSGRIWVESQPGEGSTFFFTIPDRA